MFKKIRKCLDDCENVFLKLEKGDKLTIEEEIILDYFNLHLAEALMQDWGDSEKIAKIILANKDMR